MLLKNTEIQYLKEPVFDTGNLSLQPLVTYLQKIVERGHSGQNLLPKFGLDLIKEIEQQHGSLEESTIEAYQGVFEMIHSMQEGLRLGEEGLWALGYPIPQQTLYGTGGFFSFLESGAQLIPNEKKADIAPIQHLLYRVILERFYDVPGKHDAILFRTGQETIDRYYELQVDFSFVDIQRKGELPAIDLTTLRDRDEYSIEDLDPIFQLLNPNNFTFSGFTIISFQDKTIPYVSERLRTLITDLPQYKLEPFFLELQRILSTISGSKDVLFSLLPILKLNGYPILAPDFAHNSILFDELQKRKESGEMEPAIAAYLENSRPILYGIEKSLDTEEGLFRQLIERHRLASYICIPLRHRKKLVGFVELYSGKPNVLNKASLVIWHRFIPLLAQLAAEALFIFKSGLEQIILNNFTALNPAVEWRFNEVAAEQLASYMREQGAQPIERVRFEKVYPIYGAIDVKGSTQLRNSIYRKDGILKINRLEQFLDQLSQDREEGMVGQLIQRVHAIKGWLQATNYDRYMQEVFLFLQEELFQTLEQIKNENPAFGSAIETFIAEQKDLRNDNRTDIFETSLQQLNSLIKEEVQQFNEIVQGIFPSYFEWFRSDGIEYDLYVGQSITPTKAFDPALLREIRKQQFISMARIAKRAAQIEKSLAVPMQVTLLIFVHGSAIDISFREDERRFDVDGGYNIRYQMVKKRIDKARIAGSRERLVRPNTLAIVFQGDSLEKEITAILEEVAAAGFLKQEVERCTLEEIQGVSEMRALRTDIMLDEVQTSS